MIEGLPDQKLPSAVEYLKGNYDIFDLNETVKEALYNPAILSSLFFARQKFCMV